MQVISDLAYNTIDDDLTIQGERVSDKYQDAMNKLGATDSPYSDFQRPFLCESLPSLDSRLTLLNGQLSG